MKSVEPKGASRGTIFSRSQADRNLAPHPMDLEADYSLQRGHRPAVERRARRPLLVFAAVVVAYGCSETLDAGHDRSRGMLPVDQRNPLVLLNDGAVDNWSGEYAVLLANAGGPRLAGIIVNTSAEWPDIQKNVNGYRTLIAAARSSGIDDLPDPIASIEQALVMPSSGAIEDTRPNRSEGALAIVDLSRKVGAPYRPLVVATGGALTDIADAYLVDPTVVERVVVVSSLGSATNTGGGMGIPNGDRDPWADFIVAARFPYVQVSTWYDQLTDVTTAKVMDLPQNALGTWIASKQPNIQPWSPASDQVSVLAAGLPTFATTVQRVSAATSFGAGATVGPNLSSEKTGPNWLVSACDGTAAVNEFWAALRTTR